MNVKEAIEKRQSVRRFIDRDVEQEKIEILLEAARRAPSWKNLQCWKFILIDEREQMERLVKVGAMHEKNSWAAQAPLWLVGLADPGRSGRYNSQAYYMLDMGIAMQQIVLQAVELELGSTWLGLFDGVKMAAELEVPEPWCVVAVLALGYPDWSGVKKDTFRMEMHRNRRSLKEMCSRGKWSGGLEIGGK